MPDVDVLRRGLYVVSNCRVETGDIWHAHFGVAAIASYFLIQDNDLSTDTASKINIQATAMLDKHEFSRTLHGTHSIDKAIAERGIVDALESSMDLLHWVGHNVIYAALSMLAIRELDGWGSESDIHRIEELIRSFERTIPGRSWIGYSASEVKKMEIDDEDHFPSISNASCLSEFILEELSLFKVIYRAEAHHDLIGHMLTFSHSLNILYDLGYHSLFHIGIPQLLKMVKVLRSSRNLQPNDVIKLFSPVDHLPLTKSLSSAYLPTEREFWDKDHSDIDWDDGHQFKFAFSYYNHVRRVPHLASRTEENFRHIIRY